MFAFVCVARRRRSTDDLSSSAILTSTDLHFRAPAGSPEVGGWVPGGGKGLSEKVAKGFYKEIRAERTATRIVNNSESPHTLGVR